MGGRGSKSSRGGAAGGGAPPPGPEADRLAAKGEVDLALQGAREAKEAEQANSKLRGSARNARINAENDAVAGNIKAQDAADRAEALARSPGALPATRDSATTARTLAGEASATVTRMRDHNGFLAQRAAARSRGQRF